MALQHSQAEVRFGSIVAITDRAHNEVPPRRATTSSLRPQTRRLQIPEPNAVCRMRFHFGADPKGAPNLLPILQGGESTRRLAVEGGDETTLPIDYITYRFTDTDGLRWQRTGTEQPTLVSRPGS